MGDMIDRDAVLALFNDWLLYTPSGHSVTYEVCEAIRALPAAPAEDVRAGALRDAAAIALLHRSKVQINEPLWQEGQDWAAQHIADCILALISEAKPAENVRSAALKEAIQLVGDQAVEILLRHKPDATSLLKQATRQGVTAPLRALLKEVGDG